MQNDLRTQLREPIAAAGQSAISRATGIPQPNISAWLAGRRPMSLDNCAKIAEACGYRLSVTLTAAGSSAIAAHR